MTSPQTGAQAVTYADLSLDEGGDVFIVVEDGDGLQQVGLQPIPVLRDLLPVGACNTPVTPVTPVLNRYQNKQSCSTPVET